MTVADLFTWIGGLQLNVVLILFLISSFIWFSIDILSTIKSEKRRFKEKMMVEDN